MLNKIFKILIDFIFNKIIGDIKQFFRFCVTGITGAIIDFGFLYLLIEFANLNYLLSATISFVLALIDTYLLNKYWTFQNKENNHAKQFSKFLLTSLVGLLINLGIMYLMVDVLLIWYIFAKIIASIIVLFWNFLMNKHFTFKITNF